MSLCTALFCANPVVKSGDHAGQTPFEIIILLNASKFYGYGDDCMCVCVFCGTENGGGSLEIWRGSSENIQ